MSSFVSHFLLSSWLTFCYGLFSILMTWSLTLLPHLECILLIVQLTVRSTFFLLFKHVACGQWSTAHLHVYFWTLILGGKTVDVPRQLSYPFAINVQEIEKAVLQHEAKVLFLTSPNNPDGGIIADADIDRLLQLPVLVVLDEAYIEFSDSASSRISDVPKRQNLVVLRTFSKRAALAGATFQRLARARHS